MCNRVIVSLLLWLLVGSSLSLGAAEQKIKIRHRYLNFPISRQVERKMLTFMVGGQRWCYDAVRLTAGQADYWVFHDVSELKGKELTLIFDGDEAALQQVIQADSIMHASEIYHELYRPQYHFTTRRGWINDPNGLIYNKGVYHLYYQHNPFEADWGNMHWGHAVSRDLVHWEEQPIVLHPDELGTMFSGTAVLDEQNTASFGSKRRPAIVAAYTADNAQKEIQCLAYSLDEGQHFSKYAGNPVVDSYDHWNSHDTRDPKLFWYAPACHWVMVLNERDGNTIYTSPDLKTWTPKSHVTGFWECPELFSLRTSDASGTAEKWVMWGASGTYMLGSFDGTTFVPETSKMQNLNGSAYAAQTFNGIPDTDGRRIKMAWGRIAPPNMPFNGVMLLPQEQTLRSTSSGLRLCSYPVAEVEQLFSKAGEWQDLSQADANQVLQRFNDNDCLRLRFRLRSDYATAVGLSYRGTRLVNYDLNNNLLNGAFYAAPLPGCMTFTADVYVDRTIVEVFIDGGLFSYSFQRDPHAAGSEGYQFFGSKVTVEHLQIDIAKPIWNNDKTQ